MVKTCKKGPVFENLEKIKVGLSVGKKGWFYKEFRSNLPVWWLKSSENKVYFSDIWEN